MPDSTAFEQILNVTVFGPLVIILALTVRYLFNRLILSYQEKEAILRESLRNDTENTATLKKAIELFEARHEK